MIALPIIMIASALGIGGFLLANRQPVVTTPPPPKKPEEKKG